MDAVGACDQGDVDMVVDDEESARLRGRLAEPARERQQLAARQGLVSELEDVGAAAKCRPRQVEQLVVAAVGRDDVEARGLDGGQLRIWRSFWRKASGALSCSQQTLTSRLSPA